MRERLDIVDEHGNPTGQMIDRETAHAQGIRHRTSHVWIVREKDGKTQILLQKRCAHKDSFPGCYDISSAGHIPAGQDFVPSAIRELQEELGIDAEPQDLVYCGDREVMWDGEFHGRPFHDRQYTKVFLLRLDLEEAAFSVDPDEVESVRWMDFKQCLDGVEHNMFPHCIMTEELRMLEKVLHPIG